MDSNKRIVHLIILTCLLFLSIIVYLTHFQIFKSANLTDHAYNKRRWEREDNTIRGSIYDKQ